MKKIKTILALMIAFATLGVIADDSAPFFLNTAKGTRIAKKTELISYSTEWDKGSSVRVTADGTTLKEAVAPASGDVVWDGAKASLGLHTLTHVSGGKTLTAQFTVLGDDVVVHSGVLKSSEIWDTNKVHLVTGAITVPSGVSLTINSGAVVKFMPGMSITVVSGGSCTASGAIFTHVNDDTIGGDTMMDKESTEPKMGEYTITGNVIDDDTTEYRYSPPQTLTSNISSDTRLRGYRTYIVSNSVTVASGAKLTLQPGTVLKFNSGCSLTVNGTLDAKGMRAAPIVFTSLKDDEHGGDTNGDGDKTYAQGGDWKYIYVSGTANLKYCKAMYGAPSNETGIIETSGAGSLDMDCCVVAHARYDGIWNWGGTIFVKNTVIFDTGWATAPYRGSRNEYINCIFYGNNVGVCYWSNWGGNPVYRNCIFSECGNGWCELNSGSYGDPPSSVGVYNCLFWNPVTFGSQSCGLVGSNGNIWGDPLFVDPDNGDFRIKEGSPCIDAADTAIAPSTDYYGQPRVTLTYGVTNVLPLADIGISEVMPRNIASDIDLVPENVTSSTNVAPGQSIVIKWTVRNNGGKSVDYSWRDTVSLVSENGREVVLGEKVTTAYIAAGGSASCSASFVVPAISEGKWYAKVNVNSYRDVFEGALGVNNALVGDRALTVKAEALDPSVAREGVIGGGTPSVIKLTFGADDENRMVKFDVPAGVKITWGFGFMPQGASQSGSMTATDGGVMFRVPEGATDVYVVLESDKTATYEMTTESTKMVITGVTPNRILNKSQTTIVVNGAGFSEVKEISLSRVGEIHTPLEVHVYSDNELSAVFKTQDLSPGEYLLSIVGLKKSANYPVSIFSTGVESKLVISVDKPSAVRHGRWYAVKIKCRNEGDVDASVPIVTLHGESEVFRNPDDGVSEKMGSIRSIFLSKKGNPFVFRAGQEESVTIEFKTMGLSDNCNLTVQRFIKGVDKILWENLFVTSSNDEGLLKKAKDFYGETTDMYFEEIFRRIEICTNLGYYPKCVDEFYESSFLLKNSKLLFGSIHNKKDKQLLNDGVLRVLVPGKGTKYGRVNSNGSFFVYGFNKEELEGAKYTLVNNYNPVQVLNSVSGSNSVEIVLSAQIESITITENDDVEEVRSGCVIQKSVLFVEGKKTLIAILTVEGNLYIANVGIDGTLKTEYAFSKSQIEKFKDFHLIEGLNGNRFLIVEAKGTNGDDKIYKYVLSNGLPFNTMVCNKQEQFKSKFFFANNENIGALYVTDEGLKMCNKYNFTEDISMQTMQYKAYKPGDYFDWNASFDVLGVLEFDGRAHISTVINRNGCCSWNMKGTCEAVGGCKIIGIPKLSIPLTVTTDMNITCDRKKECSQDAEIILDGVNTASGGVGISMEIAEDVLEKVDIAIANAIYTELKLPGTISQYVRPFQSSLTASGNIKLTRTQNIGYQGEELSTDWDLGVYGSLSYNIGLGAVVGFDDKFLGSLTTTFGDVSLNYGVSIGTSGITVGDGSIDVQWGHLRGSAALHYNPLPFGDCEVGPFKWEYISGVHNQARKNKKVLAMNTYDDVNILDYPEYYGDFEMKIRHPIWVYCENGGVALWEKDCTDGSNVWKSIKGMYYNSIAKCFEPAFDIIDVKNIVSKTAISITNNLWMSVISSKDSTSKGALWSVLFDGSTVVSSEKISNVNGFIPQISLERGCDGAIKLGYVRISQDGFLLCYREYVDNQWSDEVVIDSNTKEGFIALSMAKANKYLVSYTVGGRHFLVHRDLGKIEISNNMFQNEEESSLVKSATEKNSVQKFNVLHVKSTESSDGCDEDCNCGCGFKHSCGCPQNCPCAGNCKDGDACCDCKDFYGMPIHKSNDPNEMSGPLGLGDPNTERFVKPGEWMTYTVYFENMTNATAAAQEVYVTNPLSEWLDWSTFEMGEVSFGNQIDLGLSGKSSGTTEKRMDGTNWIVRTELSIEPDTTALDSNRQQKMCAKWYLRIVDPSTSTGWPNDPVAGFLPPNNPETHCGEGHLTYRIKLRDDAPGNVVITNSATIVFDYNEPITTDPAWWNTVVPTMGEARFVDDMIATEEGSNIVVRIFGGNAYSASSTKLYLTYNTAAAADIDLKNGAVDSSTGVSPEAEGRAAKQSLEVCSPVPNAQAARSTNLKFPLTLTWAAGEIGEKTITIPVLADKSIEDSELLTLQLCDPVGMELGEARLCTVTITDPGYAELEAKILAGTATKAEQKAWDKLQKANAPYIRGIADPANAGKVTGSGLCAAGKKVTLKATANKGYVFTGWLKSQIALDGDRLVTNAVEYIATTPSLVIDRTTKPAKDTATSTTLTNVNDNATFYATFITADEDKAAVGLTLNGGEVPQVEGVAPSLVTNIMCGVALNWPLASSALSQTTVKVAGLPAGLKFTAKDIMKKGS
ncbi:MAG: hypothetical protein IKC27_07950, partial [Kiritimatiellae bacterium]|nr:hypothetical protein [Kiritimatiellia bacterium]